jgi:hypothetical protein
VENPRPGTDQFLKGLVLALLDAEKSRCAIDRDPQSSQGKPRHRQGSSPRDKVDLRLLTSHNERLSELLPQSQCKMRAWSLDGFAPDCAKRIPYRFTAKA